MQVRVCPKCNAENKESNSACSSCYASLDGVPLTESTKPEEPIQQAPQQDVAPPPEAPASQAPPPQPEAKPGQMSSVGPPAAGESPSRGPAGPVGVGDLTSRGAAPGQPPSPYGPPPVRGPVGPPQMMRERPRPTKQGPNVGAIVFITILIAGAAFAGWWFFLKPLPPEQVVQKFFDAAKTNDIEKVKPYLTRATLAEVEQQQKRSGKTDMGMSSIADKIKVGTATYEGADKNTALVSIEPEDKSKMPFGGSFTIELVLVKEDGKWKIDGDATEKRMREKLMAELKKRGIQVPQGGQFGR